MEATVYFFCVVALVSSIAAAWAIVAFLFGWIPDLRAKYIKEKLYAVTMQLKDERLTIHVVANSKADAAKTSITRCEWLNTHRALEMFIVDVQPVSI